MTVSATEVGRFVEEAHLWTSMDMPRDVARFKLCVNTAEAKMRRLRRSEKGQFFYWGCKVSNPERAKGYGRFL